MDTSRSRLSVFWRRRRRRIPGNQYPIIACVRVCTLCVLNDRLVAVDVKRDRTAADVEQRRRIRTYYYYYYLDSVRLFFIFYSLDFCVSRVPTRIPTQCTTQLLIISTFQIYRYALAGRWYLDPAYRKRFGRKKSNKKSAGYFFPHPRIIFFPRSYLSCLLHFIVHVTLAW